MAVEWSTFLEDVKKHIIGLLDYESRCNLRTCSKSDLALVDSTPFVAEKISIREMESEIMEQKTILRLDVDTFTIWFVGKNDVTKVDRTWNKDDVLEWSDRKEENRYDVARRYISRHFPDGVIAAKEITITSLLLLPAENWMLNCDSLELKHMTRGRHVPWLTQSVHDFKHLDVSLFSEEVLHITPSLLNVSERLRFSCDTDMTDEHLELVRAVNFRVTSSFITATGVRTFVEKFLKYGKKMETFEFSIPLPEGFDYSQLLAGSLEVKTKLDPMQYILFEAKILGGFSNVHGIQDARKLYVAKDGRQFSIWCHIPSTFRMPLELWPFTRN